MNGLTAMTFFSLMADFIPSQERIGEILVIGFDGPITIVSLASITARTSSVATGGSINVLVTCEMPIFPFALTQYSWKWIRPRSVFTWVVTGVSVMGRTVSRTPNR